MTFCQISIFKMTDYKTNVGKMMVFPIKIGKMIFFQIPIGQMTFYERSHSHFYFQDLNGKIFLWFYLLKSVPMSQRLFFDSQ